MRTGFRLFDLPATNVQKSILSMSPMELLRMVQTSKGVRMSMKSFCFEKSVHKLCVRIGKNFISICFGPIHKMHAFTVFQTDMAEKDLPAIGDTVEIEFSGETIKMGRFRNCTSHYRVLSTAPDWRATALSMADHIISVFGLGIYALMCPGTELGWHGVRAAENVIVGGDLPADTLRTFLKNHKTLGLLGISGKFDVKEVKANEMPTIEHFHTTSANCISLEILKAMKCKSMYIGGDSEESEEGQLLNENDMIEFIEEWFNGTDTTFCNIRIKVSEKFDFKKVWTHFGAHIGTWHNTWRAQVYVRANARIDCKDAKDLRRSDGLLASIVMDQEEFAFVVWHQRHPKPGRVFNDKYFNKKENCTVS